MNATGLELTSAWFVNKHSTIYPNWPNGWAALWLHIWAVHLNVRSYHVTHVSQSESTLFIWLNVKELLAQDNYDILSLNHCNGIRIRNHLLSKQILNDLATLAKRWNFVVGTYLYGACSYHVVYTLPCEFTLYLSEFPLIPCSKQARYRKFIEVFNCSIRN